MKLCCAIFVATAAWAQATHQHQHSRMEDSKRDEWQLPHLVIMALDLKPDEVVADIGAGSGYFARRFAKHAGAVYAVDIDVSALSRARKDAPANLRFIIAAPDDPKLPADSVDTIFFCNVLHHIEGRPTYYKKLDRALKPRGRIVMIDFHKKPLPVGPPEKMKLTAEEVVAELDAAGFRKTRQHDILPYQYFLEFERK